MKSLKYLSQDEYDRQRKEYIKNDLSNKNYCIISLGWDCFSWTLPTWYGLKPTKEQGELSYPFDLAMHTLPNIIKILHNHFVDYLDDVYYDDVTKLWRNNKYYIKYNHDEGLTLEEFKNRYIKRIENFYQTINDAKNIFFIYHALNSDNIEDILQLGKELQNICIDTQFHLIVISHKWKKIPNCSDISLCYQPLPWKEYSWWQRDHLTPQGIRFEHAIINKLLKIMQQNLQNTATLEQKRKYQRLLVHILTGLIPLKKWRKTFRAHYMPKQLGFRRTYDLIIPMGENCACATLLKRANLRKYSLPFDWSGLEDSSNDLTGGLCAKCHLLLNDCKQMLEYDDFEERERKGFDKAHRFIVNKKTGLRYMHDFVTSSSFDEQYPAYVEKYTRRIERLYSEIKKSGNILIIYNKVMTAKYYRSKDILDPYTLLGIKSLLKQKWPHKKFDFLILLHDEKISATEYREEHPFSNVTYVYLNNQWPHKTDYVENEWLGNRDVVLKYLRKHIVLTNREKDKK